MLLSMTGFGDARRQSENLSVAIEVKTINSRYFKLSLRCNEPSGALEPLVESVLRKTIKRGTVQVQVQLTRTLGAEDFRINDEVLTGYRNQLEKLSREWNSADEIAVESLLGLPGVVIDTSKTPDALERDWPLVEQALEEALEHLATMRTEEGNSLAADLVANCDTISEQLDAIEKLLPTVVDQYQQRLLERVNKTLMRHDVSVDASDVVREIGIMTERSDFSEEIIRLRSHLEQFRATILLTESSGRKLDFLSQEMFREANTMGSKASDVAIPPYVIEIKAAIERIREQVQNVE